MTVKDLKEYLEEYPDDFEIEVKVPNSNLDIDPYITLHIDDIRKSFDNETTITIVIG